MNRKQIFSIISFYSILFLTALMPIMMVYFGSVADVVLPNLIRVDVLKENYYSLAFDILVLSTFIMTSYLNISRKYNTFSADNSNNFKPFFLEIIIVFLSYMINKDSSILFLDAYTGDGYIDGESFGGWSAFFIVAISYYVYKTNLKSKRNLYFCYFIIIYWFMFANRGEILPVLFFVLYVLFSKNKNFLASISKYIFAILLTLIFFAVGIIRSGNFNYSGDLLVTFLFNFTGGPVAYSFMSILYHTDLFGFANGSTFIDYIYRTLPSFITPDRPGDLSMFLVTEYSSQGGNLLIGEPYFNYGILGVFIFLHIFLSMIAFVERKASRFREFNFIFILFIFLGTRTVLYGFITFYKVSLLILGLGLLYFLIGGKFKLTKKAN